MSKISLVNSVFSNITIKIYKRKAIYFMCKN